MGKRGRKKRFKKLTNRSIGLTDENLKDIETIKNALGIVNDSEAIRRAITLFAYSVTIKKELSKKGDDQ